MVDLVGKTVVPRHEQPYRDVFFCSPEYFCEPAILCYMINDKEVNELDIAFDPEDVLEQWLDEHDAEPFSQAVDSGKIECARFVSKHGTLCELVRMNMFDEHGEYVRANEYEAEDEPTNRYFQVASILCLSFLK